jgi:hypothetical protein
MRGLRRIVVSLALLMLPSASWAQDAALSDLLLRFFSPARPVELQFTNHLGHFTSVGDARGTLNLLNRNIAYQLASFPLGSSSGGFTFTLDPSLGVLNRSAESFGPLFAERALTTGKGKLTIGANYSHATWDRFEGFGLDDGSMALTLQHSDLDGDGTTFGGAFFEGDFLDAGLFLNVETDTTVVFANYGVTDRFDIGVAVPYQRVKLDARIHTTIVKLSTANQPFVFHLFKPRSEENTGCAAPFGPNEPVRDQNDYCESGDASGIGDIVVRGKLGLSQGDSVSAAVGVDARLPTGREEDLLGTGTYQIKPYIVLGFMPKSRFSPHVNLGYTFTGESDLLGALPNEIDWTVGFDAAPASRLTITGDVIGRSLIDAERLIESSFIHNYRLAADPIGVPRDHPRPLFVTETGTMNLILGSVGFKVNPFGRLLLSANLLFPLSKNNGLQDDLTPVFALDYNF